MLLESPATALDLLRGPSAEYPGAGHGRRHFLLSHRCEHNARSAAWSADQQCLKFSNRRFKPRNVPFCCEVPEHIAAIAAKARPIVL